MLKLKGLQFGTSWPFVSVERADPSDRFVLGHSWPWLCKNSPSFKVMRTTFSYRFHIKANFQYRGMMSWILLALGCVRYRGNPSQAFRRPHPLIWQHGSTSR